MLQRHQQHHALHHPPQPQQAGPIDAVDNKVSAGGILTPSQLIAHLQQLDPSITAATPQQLHHHVHQVLHQKPSLRTLQQMLPGGPDAVELAELLSDHQKVELIAAAAAAEVDAGIVDREHLASAVVDSLEALQALGLDDLANGKHFSSSLFALYISIRYQSLKFGSIVNMRQYPHEEVCYYFSWHCEPNSKFCFYGN